MSAPRLEGMTSGSTLGTGASTRGGFHPSFRANTIHRIIVSLLLFALFAEWLHPLQKLIGDDQNRVVLLMMLTGALLLIGCLNLGIRFTIWLYPLLVSSAMYYLYGLGTGGRWFISYIQMLGHDLAEMIQSGRLYGLSIESRALLLLIGWTLLVVSVQILALGRQSITLFFTASIVYLLALEMAGERDIYAGIVRTLCWGLVLQMILFKKRLEILTGEGESHSMNPMAAQPTRSSIQSAAPAKAKGSPRQWGKVWLVAGVILMLASVWGAARLVEAVPVRPVRDIAWNEVIRAWEDWSGARLGEHQVRAYKVSGYGQDDTKLGAALSLRHERYFTGFSPYRTYWRGESKSVYTGQGWREPDSDRRILTDSDLTDSHSLPSSSSPAGQDHRGQVGGKEQAFEQTVIFARPEKRSVPLFAGGLPAGEGYLYIDENLREKQGGIIYDASAEAMFSDLPWQENLYGYRVSVRPQQYSIDQLRSLPVGDPPASISEQFLQLPQGLPERVRDLGIKLVGQGDSRYESVTAVMNYLQNNYKYNLDTWVPPAGQDFVDHFLFISKSGYCDHFSTAMTVLLRSGGVPTRWVKGFAPGKPSAEDHRQYTVSYADAHSWVEVYFPDIGWVPFDPTPGFDSSPVFGDADSLGTTAENKSRLFIERIGRVVLEWKQRLLEAKDIAWTKLEPDWLVWTSVALSFPAVLWMIWSYRRELFRKNVIRLRLLLLRSRRQFPGSGELLAAADIVWCHLYACFGSKPRGMTAREYIEAIQGVSRENKVELDDFFTNWENLYYGGVRLGRQESVNFLRRCSHLALRCRYLPHDLP